MIKCEVVFDGERIHIGKFEMVATSYIEGNPCTGYYSVTAWIVRVNMDYSVTDKMFKSMSDAVKHCMENNE